MIYISPGNSGIAPRVTTCCREVKAMAGRTAPKKKDSLPATPDVQFIRDFTPALFKRGVFHDRRFYAFVVGFVIEFQQVHGCR